MSFYGNNYHMTPGLKRRKPDRKRRALKKIGFFMLFLVALCMAVSLVFFASSLLMSGTVANKNQRMVMAGLFCGAGLFSLLGYFMTAWIRRLYASRKSHSRRSASNNGSALLIVLLLSALAVGILLGMQTASRISLRAAESRLSMTRLRLVAGDAARGMLQRLADDEDLLSDHFGEEWAQAVEIEYPDGTRVRGRATDTQRRFDLNNLASTHPANAAELTAIMLDRVMTECGRPNLAEQIDALRDWVDDDGEGPFESRFYSGRDPAYAPPNSPILAMNELYWISGWRRELIFGRARDDRPAAGELLTAIPVERRAPLAVNVNTAPPELLRALFGHNSAQIVDLLLSMREQAPLRSLSLLQNALGVNTYQRLAPFLDVKSRFFDLRIDAVKDGRGVLLNVLAERESDGKVSVVNWSL